MMELIRTAIESTNPAEQPKFAALYDEDGLLIEYIASGKPARTDYGVPGSPVWWEIEDIKIENIDVNGVSYTPKELEAKFGKELADDLIDICAECAGGEEWGV